VGGRSAALQKNSGHQNISEKKKKSGRCIRQADEQRNRFGDAAPLYRACASRGAPPLRAINGIASPGGGRKTA